MVVEIPMEATFFAGSLEVCLGDIPTNTIRWHVFLFVQEVRTSDLFAQ